jgi:hypothetical protein
MCAEGFLIVPLGYTTIDKAVVMEDCPGFHKRTNSTWQTVKVVESTTSNVDPCLIGSIVLNFVSVTVLLLGTYKTLRKRYSIDANV